MSLQENIKLLSTFLLKKTETNESIDLCEYDNIINVIRAKIESHNQTIELNSWQDEKYINDKNIFLKQIKDFNCIIKLYESESYVKFI